MITNIWITYHLLRQRSFGLGCKLGGFRRPDLCLRCRRLQLNGLKFGRSRLVPSCSFPSSSRCRRCRRQRPLHPLSSMAFPRGCFTGRSSGPMTKRSMVADGIQGAGGRGSNHERYQSWMKLRIPQLRETGLTHNRAIHSTMSEYRSGGDGRHGPRLKSR
jgi:hypothetical protein